MKSYLNELIKRIPLENKEFNYIVTFDISVPVLRCIIKAIKRKETGLQLSEEIVMKLLDADVTTVPEISQVLGLNDDIVEEIIGRLSVKNFIMVTAGNCILLSKGREALKALKQVRLETENISPVFINLVTEEIYTDQYKNQVDKYIKKENVLSGKIKIDIDYINKRFEDIKEIFDTQQNTYGANRLSKVELYKIEDVEENKIQYLNIKADIYKSKTGDEIEILLHNNIILNDIQNEILNQIINQNKFKYILKNRSRYKVISNSELENKINYENSDIRNIIKSYNKLDKEKQDAIEQEFYKIYKNDRTLLENELELMMEELTQSSKRVDIYVDKLSDVLFSEEYMVPLCKKVKKGLEIKIYYYYEKDENKTLINAKRKFPEIKEMQIIKQEKSFKELTIIFDNKYQIKTENYDIKVIGEKYITKSISNFINIRNL